MIQLFHIIASNSELLSPNKLSYFNKQAKL